MQVLKLPAIAGLIWVGAGFRLLAQQALRIFSLVVVHFFLVLFVTALGTALGTLFEQQGMPEDLVARIVVFCFGIFSPVLLIGYMEACRDVVRGERVSPLYLLRGFQLPRPAFLALLGMGLFQISALTALLSALLPEKFQLSAITAATSNQPLPEIDLHTMLIQYAAWLGALIVNLIVWYAPMLAAWHNMRIGKAMFFSVAACWRNKTAFFMFGIGWLIAFSFCLVLMSLVVAVFGMGVLAGVLLALIALVIAGAAFCSVYVTYSSVFLTTDQAVVS